MNEVVNKPAHYNQGSIECIEAMKIVLTPEEFRGYLKGNVFKYLWREKDKNGIEDLRKGKAYFDLLIELIDKYEQQKAGDLQSLKDHPFGKLKKPKWTPKVGDWVKIKKPENSVGWIEGMMDEHAGKIVQVADVDLRSIVHNGWYFRFDWLEPAEQPKAILNSDTIPEGYRKLNDSSEEPRQLGDLRWSVAEKRYIEITVDEVSYANRDNWAACRKVEPAIKQSLNTEPPDGWRWLEVGEVIRKGDKYRDLKSQTWIEVVAAIGDSLQDFHKPTIRRNRFEVGEKVVYIQDESVWDYISEINDGPNHPKSAHVASGSTSLRVCVTRLAPYIEDAK